MKARLQPKLRLLAWLSHSCGRDSAKASVKVRSFVVGDAVVIAIVVYFILAAHATYHSESCSECSENKGCAFGGEVCGSCCIVAFLKLCYRCGPEGASQPQAL
jgi:hypothetical protein